jgi:hypothetical protein
MRRLPAAGETQQNYTPKRLNCSRIWHIRDDSANLPAPKSVSGNSANGDLMSFLKKLFSRDPQPRQRVRICVECGMPIAEHKEWCSILRTQREMEARAQAATERA